MDPSDIIWREEVVPADRETVRRLCRSSGFFSQAEQDLAVELVEERLGRGLAGGYHFLFAEQAGQALGYACYGSIACTQGGWDLYWIAVDNAVRGQGWGRLILDQVEQRAAGLGCKRLYVETSGRPQYESTRAFYQGRGYRLVAELPDFYAPGDGKMIFLKHLAPPAISQDPHSRLSQAG